MTSEVVGAWLRTTKIAPTRPVAAGAFSSHQVLPVTATSANRKTRPIIDTYTQKAQRHHPGAESSVPASKDRHSADKKEAKRHQATTINGPMQIERHCTSDTQKV